MNGFNHRSCAGKVPINGCSTRQSRRIQDPWTKTLNHQNSFFEGHTLVHLLLQEESVSFALCRPHAGRPVLSGWFGFCSLFILWVGLGGDRGVVFSCAWAY